MPDLERENTEEIKIDLFSILRDVLKDWWIVLTAGIMSVLCAYVLLSVTYTPQYTSSATLRVSAKGSTVAVISDISTANNTAETLGLVLDSDILKKKVQEDLGLDSFPAQIQAAAVPETNLMTLRVTADTPQMSYRIIRSILEKYPEVTDYAMSNVVLDVLEAPSVPAAPFNPLSMRSSLKRAFVAGAVVLAGILALLSYLRDTVKNEKEVEKKLDTKLFATVYHEAKYKTLKKAAAARIHKEKKSIVITDPTVSFRFTETFKKIRTKLQYRVGEEGPKVLLVTSVAENEGKSTVAANIALALAQKSPKVLLVDGDLRRPALYKILDVELDPKQEISTYLKGKGTKDTLFYRDEQRNLYLIAGSRKCSNSTELISRTRMKNLLKAVRGTMDYIVIDSPPISLMADAEILAEQADLSLLVVKQGATNTRDINDAIDMLESSHSELLGCIYNDVWTGLFASERRSGYGYGYGYGYGKYWKYGYGQYDQYVQNADKTKEEKKPQDQVTV